MRNVILFVVVAAAALVADASPSTGHAHIAALLRRQLPGSSTSSSTGSSSFPGIDPSSITANAKCQSPCSPFTDTSAVEACSEKVSCLCGQQNYNSLSSCFQCVSPSSVSSILNC
ncbi:hypothetical protein BC827DRAFT_245748 [Russula dissimulans]|nr:hypothetical protein BC827DRAFT_245748 [Russula dissimulans]